jgi:hypothetical protein
MKIALRGVLVLLVLLMAGNAALAQTILDTGVDTHVGGGSAADTSYGTAANVLFDTADTSTPAHPVHALIQFDIPAPVMGAFVLTPNHTARLVWNVTNAGHPGDMYRMTTAWDNNTTWNTLGGSGVVPGTNALSTRSVQTASGLGFTGTATTVVTADVEAWGAGAAKFGWGIVPTDTDGQQFASFDSATKPQLVLAQIVQPYVAPTSSTVTLMDRVPVAGPYNNGQTWKYSAAATSYPAGWNTTGFNDSSWASGKAILGFGTLDASADSNNVAITNSMLTSIGGAGHITDLFRTTFSVTDAAHVSQLSFKALVEDGAVLYVNGTEVARVGMPAGAIAIDTVSSRTQSGAAESTYDSVTVDMTQFSNLLTEGTNLLAVELHQINNTSTDAALDIRLDAIYLTGGQAEILGDLVQVPEPGTTAMLIGMGLMGLVALWRRRK